MLLDAAECGESRPSYHSSMRDWYGPRCLLVSCEFNMHIVSILRPRGYGQGVCRTAYRKVGGVMFMNMFKLSNSEGLSEANPRG